VLSDWQYVDGGDTITGKGLKYDPQRNIVARGELCVMVAEIALIETNAPQQFTSSSSVVMGALTVGSLAMTLYCITDPKACFGSCPTFYAADDPRHEILAEGFSASVARPLEATDLDALPGLRQRGGSLKILMTNEALETHRVQQVRLVAGAVVPGEQLFHTRENRIFAVKELTSPTECLTIRGDRTAAVTAFEGDEYYSLADSTELTRKETIDLVFPPSNGNRCLVASTRNTLMNTWLFYKCLAWLGWSAGDFYAMLERPSDMQQRFKPTFSQIFGRIEVQVRDPHGKWQPAGELGEIGPIAREVTMLTLPADPNGDSLHVRLVMAQGYWRIDWLAVGQIAREIDPVIIDPAIVWNYSTRDDEARKRLSDGIDYLNTTPGDRYTLEFPLPDSAREYEFFLESSGYYIEWMRPDWLDETDPAQAAAMLRRPRETVNSLAGAFKQIEARLEGDFWNSRFGREK